MDVFKLESFNFCADDETSRFKCGEIFLTKIGKLQIECTICGVDFENDSTKFSEHIYQNHPNLTSNTQTNFLLVSGKKPSTSNDENINKELMISFREGNAFLSDHDVEVDFEIDAKINEHFDERNTIIDENMTSVVKNETEEDIKDDSELKSLDNFSTTSLENSKTVLIGTRSKSRKKTYSKKQSDSVILNNQQTLFKCKICSLEFCDKKEFREHKKSGHMERSKANEGHICELCGRKFVHKNTLELHYDIAHNPNRKLFPCNECKKPFTTEESLEAHHRHYHTKELPFVCPIENCNKKYASEKGLKYHQGKHSKQNFPCSECNKSYSHKNKLQTHYKRHHLVGKVYHCDQCERSFYDPYFLKKHMICHTNERPFLCDECPSSFPRQKALVAHKKVHSGVKDEICKICKQAFHLYEGLYQHMKIRHGIKYFRGMTIENTLNIDEVDTKKLETLNETELKTLEANEITQ